MQDAAPEANGAAAFPVRLWLRVPIFIRAIVVGYLVLMIGGLSFIFLVGNLRFLAAVPWVLPATVAFLWLYWQYFKGKGWPASLSEFRRENLRAAPLPGRVWGWAMVAGGTGLVSVLALRFLLPRLLYMNPPQFRLDLSTTPVWTVWAIILSVSLTAGVTEEAAFRGYMQRPLEQRYGLPVAIGVVGFMFWIVHLSHGWLGVTHLPFHLAISAVLGVLSARTGSILPAVVLHTIADVILLPIYLFESPAFFWRSLTLGPVWKTGVDGAFAGLLASTVIFAIATVPAFRKLARVSEQSGGPSPG